MKVGRRSPVLVTLHKSRCYKDLLVLRQKLAS